MAADAAVVHEDHDPHETNLMEFHQHVNFERRLQGNFARVRRMANAIHGQVVLYRWQRDGEADTPVIVKMMATTHVRMNEGRWANDRQAHLNRDPALREHIPHQEDAMTEIGAISYLTRQADCPRYLLRMLDCFHEGENTWLVTEFADGGEFFDHVSARTLTLTEETNRRYLWQLLQAVRYLHQHHIGHRDISLENILITFAHDAPGLRQGEFRLMDFGGACRTHSRAGQLLRYWRPVGKAYYRPPECVIPQAAETQVLPPADWPGGPGVLFTKLQHPTHRGYLCEVMLPEDARPSQPCNAALWGYSVPSMDIFAVGVSMFIMSWGLPPWGQALLNDRLFKHVYSKQDDGVADLLRQWRREPLSPAAMHLLTAMMRPNPSGRPDVEECLVHDWFAPMAEEVVPVHLPHAWEAA